MKNVFDLKSDFGGETQKKLLITNYIHINTYTTKIRLLYETKMYKTFNSFIHSSVFCNFLDCKTAETLSNLSVRLNRANDCCIKRIISS